MKEMPVRSLPGIPVLLGLVVAIPVCIALGIRSVAVGSQVCTPTPHMMAPECAGERKKAGDRLPRPNSAPYTSTKHAITGLTKSIALDCRQYEICCSQIDIGNAATEMTARMSGGVLQANGTLAPEPTMDVNNVAKAVLYIASLALDSNVLFMTVMANTMPFVGRG